ncbi:MAG: C40 family peptidase [Acidimicrobiales bacterium]
MSSTQNHLNQVNGQLHAAQAQATAINSELQNAQAQLDELAQQYEVAQQRVQTLDAQLTATRAEIAQTQARVAAATLRLRRDALQAYMSGTSSAESFESLFNTGGAQSLATQEYRHVASANIADAIDQLNIAQLALTTQQTQLQITEAQAKAAAAEVASSQQRAQAVEQQVKTALSGADAQVTALVQQQQQAQQAYQTAKYQAQLAAEQAAAAAAAAAAAEHGGGTTTVTVSVPQSAQGAIQAAESQIGVPYVWGAESPRGSAAPGFDCSGLMQWSWDQAGVSLPRTAAEQYDSTTHIPMADIEPGDLVFWDDGTSSVQHVGMYVGNGDVIDAPQTGQDVQIQPIWDNGLVGAGRV